MGGALQGGMECGHYHRDRIDGGGFIIEGVVEKNMEVIEGSGTVGSRCGDDTKSDDCDRERSVGSMVRGSHGT